MINLFLQLIKFASYGRAPVIKVVSFVADLPLEVFDLTLKSMVITWQWVYFELFKTYGLTQLLLKDMYLLIC